MKNTLKTICALILCAAAFACTDQLQDDAVKSVITADVTSINEIAANNPAEFAIRSNLSLAPSAVVLPDTCQGRRQS